MNFHLWTDFIQNSDISVKLYIIVSTSIFIEPKLCFEFFSPQTYYRIRLIRLCESNLSDDKKNLKWYTVASDQRSHTFPYHFGCSSLTVALYIGVRKNKILYRILLRNVMTVISTLRSVFLVRNSWIPLLMSSATTDFLNQKVRFAEVIIFKPLSILL